MRNFRIRTCSSNARAASVPPPEGPEEAAEGSPFTETWEFRAIVAEAVTAALAQAMNAMPGYDDRDRFMWSWYIAIVHSERRSPW